MAVEIEREGIPVAVISALAPVAVDLGANRVVRGVKIPHPCGDPTLDPGADRALRRRLVSVALQALTASIAQPTIFSLDGAS
jgi:glycine reductase